MKKNLSVSLLIDRFCAFFPLLARRSSAVTHWTPLPLCLWRTRLWNLNPSIARPLILFQRVIFLDRLYTWLAACLHGWYRTKKLSGHVVFLLLRISHLAKDSFLLPHRSTRTRSWSLCLFLSWVSILFQWVTSACIVCILFQMRLYTAHTVWKDFLVMKEG